MYKCSRRLWLALILAAALQCTSQNARCAPYQIELGSGLLGLSAIGLFKFSLSDAVQGYESLSIGTYGSNFDTEIALYDGVGQLVATNDDMSSTSKLSQLSFSGSNTLAAGDYTVVLGGFNTLFGDGKINPGSSSGGNFQIGIQSTQALQTPSSPSYVGKDGYILPKAINEIELAKSWMNSGTVRRFDFDLETDILGDDWFAIITTGARFDSEIALYDAQGNLVATNDDINPRNPLSRLSFGLDGDNGRKLLAGAYTLLVGGFNTIFDEDGVNASTSSSWEGDFAVYVQTSHTISTADTVPPALPEPPTVYLVCLGIALVLRLKRRIHRISAPSRAPSVPRGVPDNTAAFRPAQ